MDPDDPDDLVKQFLAGLDRALLYAVAVVMLVGFTLVGWVILAMWMERERQGG